MDADPSSAPAGDGRSDQPRRPRRPPAHAAGLWVLGLLVTSAAAIAAATSALVLTVFGLRAAVLAAAASCVLIGATLWRRGMLPLAVIGLALTLPAVWAANADQRIDRSRGPLLLRPLKPADLASGTYRRGIGPVRVDLRYFRAAPGSTTRIAARADAGELVVALPQGRCFNLDVRFHEAAIQGPSALALRAVRAATGEDGLTSTALSSLGLTRSAIQADNLRSGPATLFAAEHGGTLPYHLVAFNRWATEPGRYQRAAAGQPDAPTLRLDLSSSQQITIRDYPNDVNPLPVSFSEKTGLPSGGRAWPEGIAAPPSPVERLGRAARSAVRTHENRARWIAWEARLIDWAKAQAKRAAGPCASDDEIRARGFIFLTQPETLSRSGHTDHLQGTGAHRRSTIPQRTVADIADMLAVEVDGFGATQLVGKGVSHGAGNDAAGSPR